MHEFDLCLRTCECCDGQDFESVWTSDSFVERTSGTWKFPVSVVVCRNCGFCFSSPGPKREDLMRYYAEGFSGYKEIGLPYTIDTRMEVLKKYRAPEGVFAEIEIGRASCRERV